MSERSVQQAERATSLAAGIPPDFFLFLAFLLLPILGRVLRGAQARAEKKMRESRTGPMERGRAAPRPKRSAGEPDVGELEQSGADLWRRLLEGEEPVRVPQPAPAPAPVPVPRALSRRPAEPPPTAALEESLAAPGEPELGQLAAIPEVAPPASEVPSLAAELAASMSDTRDDGLPGARALGLAPFSPGAPGGMRDELARAVLWSEILAPPLALRERDSDAAWHS